MIRYFVLLPILIAVTSACSFVGSGSRSIDITCDEFQRSATVSEEIEITVNEEFIVVLCSNPTTGFSWSTPAIGDPSITAQVSHEFLAPDGDANPPALGAAGKDRWRFEGLSEGSTEISISYVRPGAAGTPDEWSFTISVTVVDHGFI